MAALIGHRLDARLSARAARARTPVGSLPRGTDRSPARCYSLCMESSHAPAHSACHREHVVEFYETTAFLVGTVADFLVPALRNGDSAVVVATPEHCAAFTAAIAAEGVDLDAAIDGGRLQSFSADELLAAFMVDGVPDAARFERVVGDVLDRAAAGGRAVKVYGEMVALLWADGDVTSTIALEDLWNDLALSRSFSLLCAYPMQGFDDDTRAAFKQICTQHSDVIPAAGCSMATAEDEQRRIVAELRLETAALRAELRRLRREG